MSSSFDKFAILDSFLDEVGSYLPEIEANLNRLEQAPEDSEALEEAYRRTHTISGSASMMDFPGLSQVAHAMEDVLGDALDEVFRLDGSAIELLRRSLERARLLLESIKGGTGEEGRFVAEDAADHASFRQMRAARAGEANGSQDVEFEPPAAPTQPAGSRHYGQGGGAAEAWLSPDEQPTEQPAESSGPADWLALLGNSAGAASTGGAAALSSAEAPAGGAGDVDFREHITRPLARGMPAEPAASAASEEAASASFRYEPAPATPGAEQQPSLAEMLAAFQAPTDGEWPEQPHAATEAGASFPAFPDAAASGESTWAALIGRERMASISQPLDAPGQEPITGPLPRAFPASPSPQVADTSAGKTTWQQLVEQEERVRQEVGALKETLAALRAVAASIEGERAELRGFLDGSKDAIDRVEDWAGRAMGLNLRQSPDHVRRYLPLSVLWVVTTRLKKVLGLLKDASSGLAATDNELGAASARLAESMRACGPLISSILAMAAPNEEGGFSATVARFSWSPPASAKPELSASLTGELRAQLRAEVESRMRAEIVEQVRQEETNRIRAELEVQVRQQFLAEIQRNTVAPPSERPAAYVFSPSLLANIPQPVVLEQKRTVRATEQSEETLEVFRAEAEEHLQNIDTGVTALQRSPEDRETLQGIRRATHTLKGAAAMMGFVHIADLAHVFEDLLDRMMEGSIEINTDALSLILDTSEALELLVTGRTSKQGGDAAVVESLRPRYHSLLGQESVADVGPVSAPAGTETTLADLESEAVAGQAPSTDQGEHQAGLLVALATHGEAADKSDLSVRIRLKKLDELVDLFGELLVNRSVLEERLSRMMRMVSDVGLSSARLQEVGTNLESRFEAVTLPSGRIGQSAILESTSIAGSASGPLEQGASSRGRGIGLPSGALGGNAGKVATHLADFDELELDRYSEFHRLTRGLSEGVSDMATLSMEMEAIIRECESLFLKETRLSSSFQDQLLKVRLVPISTMIPRLHRAASAVALRLGKEIDLAVEGEETEVDRTIYEEMAGALLHVVRNAVTHAIELPEAREASGKPRAGQITLSASHEGNQIVVTVRDDGTGIDAEKVRNTAISRGLLDARAPLSEQAVLNLIFRPGFSTADSITEESGRGVGLDVVADVAARLRGSVEVESTPGNGSAFTLKFPISVQIQRAVLARVADQTYAIPMSLVEQIGRLDYAERTNVLGVPAITVRGEAYALAPLASLLGLQAQRIEDRSSVLLVAAGRQHYALVVDSVLGKQEIVAKNLGLHLREVRGVAGATVLGNGQVVLILDVLKLLEQRAQTTGASLAAVPGVSTATSISAITAPTRLLAPTWTSSLPTVGRGQTMPPPVRMEDQYVLVVDDSPSVRRVVSNMLKTAGWDVQTARDGIEALDVAGKRRPAAVLLDIEMPRMDGYELIATLRSQDQYKHLPLIVLTSRAAGKHHQRAMQLGADAYLVKPYQDEELINTLGTLVRGAQATN
ncbi:MAG TPA: Hpt domain-containing protein [Ktedonobacterales bacterium]|jgi:chemotaxis protein histidine kinase CheA/ActR/RegA family two-component response regulator